jgi:hypothetical protein
MSEKASTKLRIAAFAAGSNPVLRELAEGFGEIADEVEKLERENEELKRAQPPKDVLALVDEYAVAYSEVRHHPGAWETDRFEAKKKELIAALRPAPAPAEQAPTTTDADDLRGQIMQLRRALTRCRPQWIHSFNARTCLEALGELPSEDEQATQTKANDL